jgi:transcriptional regulator with XRE-family HTH domain/tetratricopeptide (TPR) repeat protein
MFGPELKTLRTSHNYTLRGLGKHAGIDYRYLSELERGLKNPSTVVAGSLDRVFDTGTRLRDLAVLPVDSPQAAFQIGRFAMERRELFANLVYTGITATTGAITTETPPATVRTGVRVGAADVTAAKGYIHLLQQADEQYGGGIGRDAVAAFLSGDLYQYCQGTFTNRHVRSQMLSVAAQTAYLAGWKHHDLGAEGAAERYWRAALTLATEAEQPGQQAWILRILALQGLDIKQPRGSVAHAQAAVAAAKGLGGHTEALMHITAARAHAETGDHRAARACIKAATPHLNTTPDPDTPDYIAAWCPHKANLLTQTAHTLTEIGAHHDAADHYATARDLWDPTTQARVWGMDTYLVGQAYLRIGEDTAAENEYRAALNVMETVMSTRTQVRSNAILKQMPHLA